LILDPEVSPDELSEILEKKNPESFIVYDGERSRPALNEMMKHADFFIASETLLDMNGPARRSETLRTMRKSIQGELIFTFGESGCVWVQKDELIHLNAYPSVKVVDTTGAGDVFHACFAYFFSKYQDILQTLRLSSFCAGKSTERLGNREHKDLTNGAEEGKNFIHSKKLSEDEFENLIQTRAPQS
jgi:sugar/nucleoside kinase (ribokinase family)